MGWGALTPSAPSPRGTALQNSHSHIEGRDATTPISQKPSLTLALTLPLLNPNPRDAGCLCVHLIPEQHRARPEGEELKCLFSID